MSEFSIFKEQWDFLGGKNQTELIKTFYFPLESLSGTLTQPSDNRDGHLQNNELFATRV